MKEGKRFVTFEMSDIEFSALMEMMSSEKFFNRSEFIRRLIREEYRRRNHNKNEGEAPRLFNFPWRRRG
jgi:metal-responsive CopG/Arc/MetJ family transcriptional regulator